MTLLFHFLGGIHFAIALITTALLFVIAGTFLESWSDSHLFAAHFVYHNPLFKGLLWLFFINILFAALRRYPFKRNHIPFLLTHLGLLMILGGTLIKGHFGVQGSLGIAEGSGSNHLFLPNTYALQIENRSERYLIPIKPARLGPLSSPFPGLELILVEWTPHCEEKLEGWIKEESAHLLGYPPIPFGTTLQTDDRLIIALRSKEPEADARMAFTGTPLLVIAQDLEGGEHLFAFDAEGNIEKGSYPSDALYIFDKGYGGYAAYFPPLDLYSPLRLKSERKAAPRKKESLKPRICLLAMQEGQSEIIPLVFDRFGAGLKWPILGGRFLARFQSKLHPIPHHVHLHQARQIHYPNAEQTLSYEGDFEIGGKEVELSMNRVYQTSDGYRFYLSNLIHPSPFASKQVQVVVNQDPAKYWLTYPGGIVLAMGIFLLYLRRETHA